MVVGLHTVRTLDGCPLGAASFSVEDDCSDIELGFATPKKQRVAKRQRGRRVSFQVTQTVKTISNTDDFTEQEKSDAYFSDLELRLIRVELRTMILRTNQQLISSGAKGLSPEQEDKLRGLEVYMEPAKHATALRKQQAKDVVLQDDCDAEWIAKKCQEVTEPAAEIAHKLGLMDEQQAWSPDEVENGDCSTQQAPLYQIMLR